MESIGTALKELEKGGYLVRKRVRGADGRMNDTEYNFYEEPIRQTEEQPEESDDGQSGTEEQMCIRDRPPTFTCIRFQGKCLPCITMKRGSRRCFIRW